MPQPLDPPWVETDIGSGRGVFTPATDTAVVLNETAARIWDLARTGLSGDGIAAVITDEYGVDLGEAAVHVERTIAQLTAQGLLADTAVS